MPVAGKPAWKGTPPSLLLMPGGPAERPEKPVGRKLPAPQRIEDDQPAKSSMRCRVLKKDRTPGGPVGGLEGSSFPDKISVSPCVVFLLQIPTGILVRI